MKTYSITPKDISRKWYVLDASETTLGRLSTTAAGLLLGKNKPTITPHLDIGDYVIVINASSIVLTGDKETKKNYYRHSGFPGGLYKRTLNEQMDRDPTKIFIKAIRGMLPDNKLRPGRLARLKIYEGAEHKHIAQNPEKLDLKRKVKG